jgi:transposase
MLWIMAVPHCLAHPAHPCPGSFLHAGSHNLIEIMFGRLKDWRRIATRYDRCPKVFLSAIARAATVIFWL